MQRRDFIRLMGGAAFVWPFTARGQTAMRVIGFLSTRAANQDNYTVDAFRDGLAAGGFGEGKNVAIEYGWAGGQYEKLSGRAANMIGKGCALIACAGTAAGSVAKAATSTIPVIFVTADDPIDNGLVKSLNRPGGSVTGISMVSAELRPKMLQLLHELAPHAKLIHMLANPTSAGIDIQKRETQAAANANGLQFQLRPASTPAAIDAAFVKIAEQPASALLVASDPFLTSRRNQITALAAKHAVPAIYAWREFAQAGGLMSYGSSNSDGYRQAGLYAARLLKGEKPGDLPVQQPTKYELVINLKAAKALGINVPPAMQTRADELIE